MEQETHSQISPFHFQGSKNKREKEKRHKKGEAVNKRKDNRTRDERDFSTPEILEGIIQKPAKEDCN